MKGQEENLGLIALIVEFVATNLLDLTHNPWCVISKILHFIETVESLADSTLNTFHTFNVFHAQTNNTVFMVKEAMCQEYTFYFVRAVGKKLKCMKAKSNGNFYPDHL